MPDHHASSAAPVRHTHSALRPPSWNFPWHPVVPEPHRANSGLRSSHTPLGVTSLNVFPHERLATWWQLQARLPHTAHLAWVGS